MANIFEEWPQFLKMAKNFLNGQNFSKWPKMLKMVKHVKNDQKI